jgi:hypothetical protein
MFSVGLLLKINFESREMTVKPFQLNMLCIKESIIKSAFDHHI